MSGWWREAPPNWCNLNLMRHVGLIQAVLRCGLHAEWTDVQRVKGSGVEKRHRGSGQPLRHCSGPGPMCFASLWYVPVPLSASAPNFSWAFHFTGGGLTPDSLSEPTWEQTPFSFTNLPLDEIFYSCTAALLGSCLSKQERSGFRLETVQAFRVSGTISP